MSTIEQLEIQVKSLQARVDGLERAAVPAAGKKSWVANGPRKPLAEKEIGYMPSGIWREFGHLKGKLFSDAPAGFLYAYANALQADVDAGVSKYPDSDLKSIAEANALAVSAPEEDGIPF